MSAEQRSCDACGAYAGEPCFPDCTAAAEQDEQHVAWSRSSTIQHIVLITAGDWYNGMSATTLCGVRGSAVGKDAPKPNSALACKRCSRAVGQHVMTKQEFARRWDSNADGGGITFDDIAECAKAWGISAHPKSEPVDSIASRVVAASGAADPYLASEVEE